MPSSTSSKERAPDQATVILGIVVDDTLNVFVRDADHQLHQAARITTRSGADPMAMTTMIADLAEELGWRQIVAAPPEVPQLSRELPRGDRVAVAAAAARKPPTKKPTAKKSAQSYRNNPRRSRAEMQRQEDTIMDMLDKFDRGSAVTTSTVVEHVAKSLDLDVHGLESNVRHYLDRMSDSQQIGRVIDQHVLSGGRPRSRWYGTRFRPSAVPPPAGDRDGHVASFAIDESHSDADGGH